MSSLVASTSWSMDTPGSECRRRCCQGWHRHRRRCISLARNVVDDVVKAGIDIVIDVYPWLVMSSRPASTSSSMCNVTFHVVSDVDLGWDDIDVDIVFVDVGRCWSMLACR